MEALNSDDQDSAIGDHSTASSTTSLSSSVMNYPTEHGRTYHAPTYGDFYLFPNDEAEMDRLDLKHEISLKMNDGKLNLCPVKNPQRVLDIGTGTGIWALQFADQNPQAIVVGTDISPIQPESTAPNCKFEIFDLQTPWTFEYKFDFVHARDLFGCFTYKGTIELLQQAFKNLEPGGWMEIQDFGLPTSDDDTIPRGSCYRRWIEKYREALQKIDRDPDLGSKYGNILGQIGFVSVKEVRKKIPHNIWPKDEALKELGLYNRKNIRDNLEAFSLRPFLGILGFSQESLFALLAGMRKELDDPSIHAYTPVYIHFGQKPPESYAWDERSTINGE